MTKYKFEHVLKDVRYLLNCVEAVWQNKDVLFSDETEMLSTKKKILAYVVEVAQGNPHFFAAVNTQTNEVVGFFLLESDTCRANIIAHTVFARKHRVEAIEAAGGMIKAIREHFGVRKIYGPVFENNLLGQSFVKTLGFRLEYVKKDAVIKDGRLLDEYYFSLVTEG